MERLPQREVHPLTGRPTGFARYREVLQRDAGSFFLAGFLTLLAFLPFAAGMFYAIGSTSALVMLLAAPLGGAIAGPFLYAFYDLLYRSLRDADTNWWKDYQKAIRDNWRSAFFPGAVFGLFLGCSVFTGMLLFWWPEALPRLGTTLFFLASLLVSTMLWSVYWPQLVLFDQSGILRLRNCLFFCLTHFWHTLGIAAIQVGYWLLIVLFLPWSGFVLPIIGIWFVLFLANFLLYPDLDRAFHIEDAIRDRFPGQILDREDG